MCTHFFWDIMKTCTQLLWLSLLHMLQNCEIACSLSLLVIIILLVIIPICNVFNMMILGLAMPSNKFEFPWTCTTPWKSVKIQKMPSLVCGSFACFSQSHLHFNVFLISRTFRQPINIKICIWKWSWEKIFDFQLHSQILTIF